MNAELRIADFLLALQPETIPAAGVLTVRRAIADTIACALAGRNEPASQVARNYARDHSAPMLGRVWATGENLPVELAALVNGVMGHVLDYDDVTSPMRGHPSIAMLPALIAVAEARNVSLQRLICAYVAGLEIVCRISRASATVQYAKGWHTTSSIGMLGATTALCHLLALPRDQILASLGLAVAQASGTLQSFGSMAKSLQAGQAGAAALRAVHLAELGFTGGASALDAANGYGALYADGEKIGRAFDDVGETPLEVVRSGVEVKKYPCCYAAHRAIDGLLDLRAAHPALSLDDIEEVSVTGSFGAYVPLIHEQPQTGLEAKFSLQYAVAAAIEDGAVGFASFYDEAVQRAKIQSFMPRIKRHEAEGSVFPRWTELELRLRDGSRLQKRVEALRGSAELPLSNEELMEKVKDCWRFGEYQGEGETMRCLLDADATRSVSDILDEALPQNTQDK